MDGRELEAARLLADALMRSGRFAAARDVLGGLAAAVPEDAFARRNLTLAHLRLGDYAAALPLARAAADSAAGPELAPALFLLAHALWGTGEIDECRRVVDRYAGRLAAEREGPGA